MAKVIVERPRLGGHGARRGRASKDLENLPGFLGVRKQVRLRGGYKMLNEYLAPLRKYLESQLNRPWNKVHGEIRERIKPGNTVQEHVLSHIEDFLATQVEKKAATTEAPCGLVRKPNSRLRWRDRALKAGELYVDPDDGIIKRARRRLRGPSPPKGRAPEKGCRQGRLLEPDLYGFQRDGVWYAVDLKPYEVVQLAGRPPEASSGRPKLSMCVMDRHHESWPDPLYGPVLAHDTAKLRLIESEYGAGVLAGPMRQLGHRELRARGLENTLADS